MVAIKQEVRTLDSRHPDQSLMYPGKRLFPWVKPSPLMPWLLASIEELPPELRR